MNPVEKRQTYRQTWQNIEALNAGERDEIAALATVAAELHHAFSHFRFDSAQYPLLN